MLGIVVAYGRNRVIGKDGDLPWHLPADLAHFRRLTMGSPVIMGRKTYESIPDKYRPLPGRRNLILSANPDYAPAEAGAEVVRDLDAALAAVEGHDAFVIGGQRAFSEALAFADRIYATEVELAPEGDAFFPILPREWTVVEEGERTVEDDGAAFTIRVYERPLHKQPPEAPGGIERAAPTIATLADTTAPDQPGGIVDRFQETSSGAGEPTALLPEAPRD